MSNCNHDHICLPLDNARPYCMQCNSIVTAAGYDATMYHNYMGRYYEYYYTSDIILFGEYIKVTD